MNLLSVRNLLGGVTLSLGILLSVGNANANTTNTFIGTVFGGFYDGIVGTGSFTYDETLITGIRVEEIFAIDGNGALTVNFTIFGQTFTELNDIDSPFRPSLGLEDGEVVFLDFIVDEELGPVLTDIDEPGVLAFDLFELFSGGDFDFEGDVFVLEGEIPDAGGTAVTDVPEPGALALFGIGLLGLGLTRRRRLA